MLGERLLAVQVTERDVAEVGEGVGGDLPDSADRDVASDSLAAPPVTHPVGHDHPAAHAAGVRVGPMHADGMAEPPACPFTSGGSSARTASGSA